MERTYKIEPRSADLGGGWSLKLFDRNEEMGGGVFPLIPSVTNIATDFDQAYQDALDEGEQWIFQAH